MIKKNVILALALAISFVAATARVASHSVNANAVDNNVMSGGEIGQPIADFKLDDLGGKQQTLAGLKGKNATVLIFLSARCPVSIAYSERMEKLAQDYKARGVSVIGIASNATETTADLKSHAAEHRMTFPILQDKGNKIADQLGATRTPEVFLLDATGKLVYRGRIDNQKNAAMVTSNDLRDAIDETLAGKAVTKTRADAFGCTIKRVS